MQFLSLNDRVLLVLIRYYITTASVSVCSRNCLYKIFLSVMKGVIIIMDISAIEVSKSNIHDYLLQYQPMESAYKRYYDLSLQDQNLANEFALSLPDEYKSAICNAGLFISVDYFSKKEIEARKHARYSPVFQHDHLYYEIFYVYEGNCTNIIQNNVMSCKKGDICFIPPHVSHSMSVFDDSIIINLIVRESAFNSMFSNLFSDRNPLTHFYFFNLYKSEEKNYLLFKMGDDSSIRSIIEDIYIENMKPGKYSISMQRSLFSYLLVTLIRNHESDLQCFYQSKKSSINISEMLIYFQKNFYNITLKSAADHFGFSETYFSKLIKKNVGRNFVQLIRDIRLEHACRALLETNLSIQKICEIIGYDSPAHFSRAFKQAYGITANEYRAKYIN